MANMFGKQFIFMFMTTLAFFLVVSTTTHARHGKNFEFTKFSKTQQTPASSNKFLDAKKFYRQPNFYQQTSVEDHVFGQQSQSPPAVPPKYTTVQERYQTAYNPDAENNDDFSQATKEEEEKPTHTTNPAQQQYHYQNYNGGDTLVAKEEEEDTAQKYQYQSNNYAYNKNAKEENYDKNKFHTYYQQQQTNPTAYETTTNNNQYYQQQQQQEETKHTPNNYNYNSKFDAANYETEEFLSAPPPPPSPVNNDNVFENDQALNEYLSSINQQTYNNKAAAQNNYNSFVQAENDEKPTTRSSYTNAELNAFLNTQEATEEFDVEEEEEEEEKKDTDQAKPNTFPGMSNTKNTPYSFNAETDQYENQNELFNPYNQDDQFRQVPKNTKTKYHPSLYVNDP